MRRPVEGGVTPAEPACPPWRGRCRPLRRLRQGGRQEFSRVRAPREHEADHAKSRYDEAARGRAAREEHATRGGRARASAGGVG